MPYFQIENLTSSRFQMIYSGITRGMKGMPSFAAETYTEIASFSVSVIICKIAVYFKAKNEFIIFSFNPLVKIISRVYIFQSL